MTRFAARPAVLVVDDSASVREHLAAALERAGAVATLACDGADAWRRLQGLRVDAVVTDLLMPVMDGLKLIRLLRAVGVHQHTPIVVVTAEGGEGDRARALALGANAYLEKPVDGAELVEAVARLLAPR